MYVIRAENVGHALRQALTLFEQGAKPGESRNGNVIRLPWPVLTSYERPRCRVLINRVRRANPFFHLMEALWMLAGRNDIKFVAKFNQRMTDYSDDHGKTQPAAYGHRWRDHFDHDQLHFVINELRNCPQSRRAVINMWDPNTDIGAVVRGGKDVPCNTSIYFLQRPDGRLDMTVSCRSNDAIWGCYGANVVHMSVLHEYVAHCVNMPLGTYHQFSNDLHIYTDVFSWDEMLKMRDEQKVAYPGGMPLIAPGESAFSFNQDLENFFLATDNDGLIVKAYHTDFFNRVVSPMWVAWELYKQGHVVEAENMTMQIVSADWRIAANEWLRTSKAGRKVWK